MLPTIRPSLRTDMGVGPSRSGTQWTTGLYRVAWRTVKAGHTAPLTEMAKMRVIVVDSFGTEDRSLARPVAMK